MKYYKIFLCYSLVKLMEDLVQKGGGTLTEVQSLYCCKPYRFFFGDNLALFDTSHSTDSEPYASPGLSECERRKKALVTPSRFTAGFMIFVKKRQIRSKCNKLEATVLT